MNWDKGYKALFYGRMLDSFSWTEQERFKLTQGSITRTDENLRQNAEIECVDFDSEKEHWIRIWLDAKQGENSAHVPLFTGITSSPDEDIDGTFSSNTVNCYSVLKPMEEVLLPLGWFANPEIETSVILKTLFEPTPAPLIIDGIPPKLRQEIIAEEDDNHLTMTDRILAAIGWRLRIHGDGTIQVCEAGLEPLVHFNPLENDSIEPKLKVTKDWFSCPNVLRVIYEDEVATVRDESLDSPLSIPNRGREIWARETSSEFNLGENIEDYAKRKLKELQQFAFAVTYDRRFFPDLFVTDVVRLNYFHQRIQGDFKIVSQKIDLDYAAQTSEEVVKI